jgi:glutamate receptor ionotropic, NMDA 1
MVNETITEAPKDCDDSGVFWETGKKLFHYLKSRNINGKTGRVVLIANFILFPVLLLSNSVKS